jgi:hypothetical protein
MAQSKQELAERNAKIRADKLRENLAKRKQQTRQKAVVSQTNAEKKPGQDAPNTR